MLLAFSSESLFGITDAAFKRNRGGCQQLLVISIKIKYKERHLQQKKIELKTPMSLVRFQLFLTFFRENNSVGRVRNRRVLIIRRRE